MIIDKKLNKINNGILNFSLIVEIFLKFILLTKIVLKERIFFTKIKQHEISP